MGWASHLVNLFNGKLRTHTNGRKWEYNSAKGVWKIKANSQSVSSLVGHRLRILNKIHNPNKS